VFNEEEAKELVGFIQLLESRLFGLTLTELRVLAFELAKKIVLRIISVQQRRWLENVGCICSLRKTVN
jgi:hypothetical protein